VWLYNVRGGNAYVWGVDPWEKKGALTIPERIAGLPVKGIDDYGFQYNEELTSLKIPGCVTEIGSDWYGAFSPYYCKNLKTLYVHQRWKGTDYLKYANLPSGCKVVYYSDPCKVTLNANGGKVGTAQVTAKYGQSMPAAKAPTRTGYTFLGYFTKKTDGVQYYDGKMASVKKWTSTATSYTLYAHWKLKTAAVTLNANGGSGGTAKVTAKYGQAMPKITVPKRTGYTLLGIYNAKSGGTKYWTASGASARTWNGSGTAYTFYAHWKAKTSTVTLSRCGGSGGTSKVTATYDKAMPKVTIPTKKGYKFMGYYNAKTGGAKYWSSLGASARNWNGTKASYTFYAHWARISTVAINKAGGTGGTSKAVVTNGFKMRTITVPTRAGYDLLGIFNKAVGGAKYWNADGTPTRAWNGTGANYTFYAQWVLAGLDPTNGVVAYNGPRADAVPDIDSGWDAVDGNKNTAWTGDEGVGEWHLLLGFDGEQAVGGIQVVGENLPADGVTFATALDGGMLEVWDGATPATFDELLLSIVNPDGIPPTVREIYFQSVPEP